MFEPKNNSLLTLLAVGCFFVTAGVLAEEPKTETPPAAQTAPPEQSQAASPAAGQVASPEPLKVLQERVDRYWAARQARDVKTLYDLESAARPGGWLKLEHAMGLQGLPVRKVKIEEVRIEGEKAITRISAEVMIGTIGWTKQTIADSWVLLDGQWYHETSRD